MLSVCILLQASPMLKPGLAPGRFMLVSQAGLRFTDHHTPPGGAGDISQLIECSAD